MGNEVGRLHVVDVEAGATVPPEGHLLYARNTDKLFKSDGTALTELASGGGSYTDEDAQDAVGAMTDTSLTYVDATPLLKVTALSGDVTSTGANVTTIANDAVSDAKLRNSAALSVIGRSANSSGDPSDIAGATVGHVLQVATGPVLSFGNNKFSGPTGLKYDPDRSPSSGSYLEEFMDGAETLTWRWGNQGTSTLSLELDRAILLPQTATTTLRARWTTPPSGVDWVITTKFSQTLLSGTALAGGGPMVLETGTEATPTSISGIFVQFKNSVPWASARGITKTSYTSATSNLGALIDVNNNCVATDVYTQIRYVTSTKTLTYYISYNGIHYYTIGSSRVLGAGPVSVGYGGETSGNTTTHQLVFDWWRLRTDSAGTSGRYECGE